MNFGLPEKTYNFLLSALRSFPEIESAAVFGSRAMGHYKPGSDVDIVLNGENVTAETVFGLSSLLNEKLPLPYQFDILNYADIENTALKQHIDEFSIPLQF